MRNWCARSASIVVAFGVLTSVLAGAQTFIEAKLAPADLIPSALFGNTVSATSKTLVAGAPLEQSVFVYARSGSGGYSRQS